MGRATAHLFGDEGASVACHRRHARRRRPRGRRDRRRRWHGRGVGARRARRRAGATRSSARSSNGSGRSTSSSTTRASRSPRRSTWTTSTRRGTRRSRSTCTGTRGWCAPACRTSCATARDASSTSRRPKGVGATGWISPYTASKHGVIGLTGSLAVELGPRGVNVNCVCPGPIHTGMTAGHPRRREDEVRPAAGAAASLRRTRGGGARDVVARRCRPSSYINGAVLVVDGGMTAKNT